MLASWRPFVYIRPSQVVLDLTLVVAPFDKLRALVIGACGVGRRSLSRSPAEHVEAEARATTNTLFACSND